jgi:hypothetical protein
MAQKLKGQQREMVLGLLFSSFLWKERIFVFGPLLTGGFLGFLKNVLYSTALHLPPSDSAVSEDAGIEPRIVATSALAVRRHSNNSARSHPRLG